MMVSSREDIDDAVSSVVSSDGDKLLKRNTSSMTSSRGEDVTPSEVSVLPGETTTGATGAGAVKEETTTFLATTLVTPFCFSFRISSIISLVESFLSFLDLIYDLTLKNMISTLQIYRQRKQGTPSQLLKVSNIRYSIF